MNDAEAAWLRAHEFTEELHVDQVSVATGSAFQEELLAVHVALTIEEVIAVSFQAIPIKDVHRVVVHVAKGSQLHRAFRTEDFE